MAAHRWRPLLLAASLALAGAGPATAARFTIEGGEGCLVRFESKAAVESFDGRTDRVSGWIECDPAALGDSARFEVAVDLASLDTGIALRNRHMRENHLQTDQYPRAYFRGGRLSGAPAALVAGQPVTLELRGEFELHGVKRLLRLPVQVTLSGTDAAPELLVEARFPVALADYDIPRPRFLLLKLGEVQQVTLKLVAAVRPAAAGGG